MVGARAAALRHGRALKVPCIASAHFPDTASYSEPGTLYKAAMPQETNGPVAAEMIRRLAAALAPTHLALTNDSAQHAGHAGHDGSGESHFSLVITSAAFEGHNRVQRQRQIYQALGDLMNAPIHALQIKANAPGE